ncbi:signal peptidase I [Streptomyces sp. NPDC059447]|uniref:signal peptidase I n=1 Tax=Streptomyces sp. NPDC059447 TaxID=3346834 RepID=UPI0036753068
MGKRDGEPGRRLRVAAVVLLVLGGVLSCVGGLGGYFFMPTKVIPSTNMQPTHPRGGSAVFNLLITEVHRGDVVLFDASVWGERGMFVERVVAVGGDRIAYMPGVGKLILNGQPLDEPYVLGGVPVAGSPAAFDVTVPEGRLFLLGDNRGNSADSRYRFGETEGGTVPLSAVKGAVIERGHPLLVGLRSALFVGVGVLAVASASGIAGLRLRRRAEAAAAQAAYAAYAGQLPPQGL